MNSDFWIILLQIIITLLSTSLIYYVQQKGKNQADKEDLDKLTTIVENIKKDNIKEIELLKSKLDILSKKEASLFESEKENIINFYSQLHTWLWDTANVHFNEYNIVNYSILETRLVTMRNNYNLSNILLSKVKILSNDQVLITLGHESVQSILAYHQKIESLITRTQRVLAWEKILVDQLTNTKGAITNNAELRGFYMDEAKDKETEKRNIWSEYINESNKVFDIAYKKLMEFQEKAKEYIKSTTI